MTSKVTVSFRDHSNEVGRTQFLLDEIAGDGSNYAALVTAASTIQGAIDDITLLDDAGYQLADILGSDPGSIPASNLAQREYGLRIYLVDNQGWKGTMTIPGPDLSALTIPEGGDAVTLADASVMAALVTALEADAISPDGNAVEVVRARVVGRNN
jgi:hypothetical protein